MKYEFKTRLEAIDWIAANAENEAMFEVMREQLTFNYIYTHTYFLEPTNEEVEVVWLDQRR